jgi:hypothetical protein
MNCSLRQGVIVLAMGLGLGASLPIGADPTQPPAPGQGGRMVFTEPSPLDFGDHQGYVSLFDGKSLKGWDGNPKFWRVEGGAIVGESTPANPSGNSYIVYRGLEAKDFTLKFEIKIEGDGGSGIQYRSKTGCRGSRTSPRTSRPTSVRSTSNG